MQEICENYDNEFWNFIILFTIEASPLALVDGKALGYSTVDKSVLMVWLMRVTRQSKQNLKGVKKNLQPLCYI